MQAILYVGMTMPKDKTAPSGASSFDEPGPDWKILAAVPYFYFGGNGFITTEHEWRDEIHKLLHELSRSSPGLRRKEFGEKRVKIPIHAGSHIFSLRVAGWHLFVNFPEMFIGLLHEREEMHIWGSIDDYWAKINSPPGLNAANGDALGTPDWFNDFLCELLTRMALGFAESVAAGAAHLMARKASPLARFERVLPDQFLHYSLDEPLKTRRAAWYDPRPLFPEDISPLPRTATGPNGEKLYSIYVAPGTRRGPANGHAKPLIERECRTYLLQEMLRSPGVPPHGTVQPPFSTVK
jgi:hypothetical protein